MNIFEKSEWIWHTASAGNDEYAEFFTEINVTSSATVRLSVDGDYVLYVNGKYAASNQYGDYEHYKIYDEIDITALTVSGKNTVSFLVWHPGEKSSRYASYSAGLIFEITEGDSLLAYSSTSTLSRQSLSWQSGRCKKITRQLGYGFHYDATREDGALFTGEGFSRAVCVNKKCNMYPRPTAKLLLGKETPSEIIRLDGGKVFRVDLSRETVGLLRLRFNAERRTHLTVTFGEHLTDGCVRRIIGERDFSIEYTARAGHNDFTSYMLRLGARYLEIISDEPIEPEYFGILEQYYPTVSHAERPDDVLDRRIYDLCLRTLELSMMEHYVDCPWREQALYAYDSRNQMLAGYYAFLGGNREYVAANLRLLSEYIRPDGLMPIVSPTTDGKAIPSFNLHYFTAVREYLEHTGDTELARELYPRLSVIAKAMIGNMQSGLLDSFAGNKTWNFYEWIPELEGDIDCHEVRRPDSVINFLFIIALDALEYISESVGEPFAYTGLADIIRKNVNLQFYSEADGLYSFHEGDGIYTELATALAVVSRTATGDRARIAVEHLTSGGVIPATLSMKCFTYDACLSVDPKYRDYVLSDIRGCWGYMLSQGATSAWETLRGEADFDGAGSLCHGWNAIPIVYYHRFGMCNISMQ